MTEPTSLPRVRPVVLYDGECGFCTGLVEQARDRLAADVDYVAFQTAPLATYGVSTAEARHSLHWAAVDGRLDHGSGAVARLLVAGGGTWSLLGRLLLAPPFSFAAAGAYWLVARNRRHIPLPRRAQ
jgi:predicted DCC family thiol-disulfide oxidoreductase YuxK